MQDWSELSCEGGRHRQECLCHIYQILPDSRKILPPQSRVAALHIDFLFDCGPPRCATFVQTNLETVLAGGVSAAFVALADFSQIIPGIDAAGVAVIPRDIQRIPAHRFNFFGLGRLLIHRQQAGGLFGGLSRIAMVIVALFRAGGAGACVTQPLEGKVRAMAVVPLDVHSGTGGDVDFDGFGIDDGHRDQYIDKNLPLTFRRTNGKLLRLPSQEGSSVRVDL